MVKQHESDGAQPSEPSPPDGANMAAIKQAWRYTSDTRYSDFHERLPEAEREKVLQAQDDKAKEVQAYETAERGGPIEGLYLELAVGS